MIQNKQNRIVPIMAMFHLMIVGPVSGQTKLTIIQNGKIVTVTDGIIENGSVLIKDGKIAAVGKNMTIPQEADIIDAENMIILPGLIDGFTNLGTADIPSFDQDDDEATDPLTPHLRIIDALNPDNRFIPIARTAGITTALCAPGDGNLLTGQSAWIDLTGETMKEMVIKYPMAVHATFGEGPKLRYGKNNAQPMTRMGTAAMMRQTLIDAQDYATKWEDYHQKLKEHKTNPKEEKKPQPPAMDLKNLALLPILKGELPLVVSADRYDDILTVLRIADEFNLKIILNHGAEAYRAAGILAQKNIPVILGPITSRDLKQETMNRSPDNAAILESAGVKIAFQTGSFENCQGLLTEAKFAVANGLAYEKAIEALTLNPAQIFGMDDLYGSIEIGKNATLVFFDEDPILKLATVQRVIISGQIVFEK